MPVRLSFCVMVLLLAASTVFAQNDRRDRQNPELIVESGGRLGSCDSLQFTSDGQFALAVGDDKVVRSWPYRDGQLQTDGMKVLRWSIWREQRGAIFALALSPDKENKNVAVAGIGQPTSTVAILERATGKMLHRVVAVPPEGEKSNALWAVAYAPSGKQVAFGDSYGGVWLWDLTHAARRLGKHEGKGEGEGEPNVVRYVRFFDEETLVSIAEDGTAKRWDLAKQPVPVTELKHFDNAGQSIFRIALSPDENWFAAATKGPLVVLRSTDGKQSFQIKLKEREYPRSVAFDLQSARLAVSIGRTLPGAKPGEPAFYMEDEDRIVFYDLQRERAETPGPSGLYRAWFLAFHPNGQDLAIAAGENHEVTLWKLDKLDKPVSVLGGAGQSLWGVALSEDGNQIAFRDRRKPQATDPNDRAEGPWRVFHLPRREWTNPADFKPVAQQRRWEGWSVEPDASSPFIWYAVTPQGKRLKLSKDRTQFGLDKDLDGMPRSYTFIPPSGKLPLRLAVGHLWGLSLFELTPNAAKRVGLLTGHQADVTALAVSADGSFLVSASTDQTISGWSLTHDWDSQPTFGGSFEIKDERLYVKKVDIGSPAWEAGLIASDEVKSFHFAGDVKPLAGGPNAWLARLEDPVPGVEHGFKIVRDGKPQPALATSVRQRPLWRFFPTRDNEWVLWMWQNSYYDTSTKGDSYIGWHVNAPDLADGPAFYRAEQFRAIYERPDVLDKLLQTNNVQAALREAMGVNPLPPKFSATEPPLAALVLAAATTQTEDVAATLTATPHGDNPDFQPLRAELWINDYRLLEDKEPDKWRKTGALFQRAVSIPNAKLRAGKNVLTFQVYNRAGGRAEAVAVLTCTRAPATPRLFGLAVGVNDYSGIKAGPGGLGQLKNLESARGDAEEMQKSWLAQTALYQGTAMFLNLDVKAKRAGIIAELDRLAQQVGPEDRCIIFLAGHGQFIEHKGTKDQAPSTTWLFCCPDYDVLQPEATSITSEVLYAKLAKIAGRKLVILDACHSGEAAANPVRSLVPGGQGPIIIASCDRNQFSYEDTKKLKHGLFTYALLEALDAAQPGAKKVLDAQDLYLYTRGRLPELLKDINVKEFAQRPILFAPSAEFFSVAQRKE